MMPPAQWIPGVKRTPQAVWAVTCKSFDPATAKLGDRDPIWPIVEILARRDLARQNAEHTEVSGQQRLVVEQTGSQLKTHIRQEFIAELPAVNVTDRAVLRFQSEDRRSHRSMACVRLG